MPSNGNQIYQKLARLFVAPILEPSQRAARIQTVEKDVILPLRVLLIVILAYFLFLSQWYDVPHSPRQIGLNCLRWYFLPYVAANALGGACFLWGKNLTLRKVQWIVFGIGFLDVILISGLTFLVNGFDSALYWVFMVLILHNALSIPVALPQILLNFLATVGFVVGGFLDLRFIYLPDSLLEAEFRQEGRTDNPADRVIDRVVVLLIWAACCYGIQVLFEKQRRAEAEATEFAVRQERLRTAGRLAAEIAHKIKNPLGIITNAAFCLQRAVNEGEFAVGEQIDIIREEVEKADRS